MSFRDNQGRQNGDNKPSFFPAGQVGPFASPENFLVKSILVVGGAANTTVTVKINGATVKTQAVALGTRVVIPGPFSVPATQDFEIDTTQTDARISFIVLRN